MQKVDRIAQLNYRIGNCRLAIQRYRYQIEELEDRIAKAQKELNELEEQDVS